MILKLEEKLDPNVYGGWISSDGIVYYVEELEHSRFISSFKMNHEKAFENNWIRFARDDTSFSLEGNFSAIYASRFIWMPFLKYFSKLHIDDMYFDKEYFTFKIPEEKGKILPKLKEMTKDKTIKNITLKKEIYNWKERYLSEDIYNSKQSFLDAILQRSNISDLYDSKYKVSIYCQTISEFENGYVENIKEIDSKNNLSYIDAMKVENSFNYRCSEMNKNKTEDGSWNDYFVIIENDEEFEKMKKDLVDLHTREIERDIDTKSGTATAALKQALRKKKKSEKITELMRPSRFLRVGKHLVEIQSSWVNKGEKKYPKMDIFSDGKRIGFVIQQGKYFLVNKEKYTDINQAISILLQNSIPKNKEDSRIKYLKTLNAMDKTRDPQNYGRKY